MAEATGWWISNSLALMGNAGHVLVDGVAHITSMAVVVAIKENKRKDEGVIRIRGLAVQITLLGLMASTLLIGSVLRFQNPQPINATPLITIATMGSIANVIQLMILHGVFNLTSMRNFLKNAVKSIIKRGDKDITSMGLCEHLRADLTTSVGVIIGGTIIIFTKLYIIDPIVSFCICGFILWQISSLLKEAGKHEHRDRECKE